MKSDAPIFGSVEQHEQFLTAIENQKAKGGSLINILQDTQAIYGYLPLEVQKMVAKQVGMSPEEVYSTVTFYHQFLLTPQGKHKINVCIGTACYVKGAGDVLDEFGKQLGIESGCCTEDGMFSLNGCRCIGVCGLAPVLTVNDDVHGKIYKEDVAGVLAQYTNSPKEGDLA